MSRTIYLAGASAEVDMCESYMRLLRDAGYTVAHDWPAGIRQAALDGYAANPRNAPEEKRHAWAIDDMVGVKECSTFWMLIPEKPTIGAWVELGGALAWTHRDRIERTIVSGDWRVSIFTSLADYRFDSHAEAFAHLTGAK